MVYCPRCGVVNEEDAEYCSRCESPLYLTSRREKRGEACFEQPERYIEDECFRIRYGGAIVGIIVGVFIILVGLTIAFNLDIWRWIGSFLIIAIGLLIILGVLLGQRRRS